jgi:hypothetical protein
MSSQNKGDKDSNEHRFMKIWKNTHTHTHTHTQKGGFTVRWGTNGIKLMVKRKRASTCFVSFAFSNKENDIWKKELGVQRGEEISIGYRIEIPDSGLYSSIWWLFYLSFILFTKAYNLEIITHLLKMKKLRLRGGKWLAQSQWKLELFR